MNLFSRVMGTRGGRGRKGTLSHAVALELAAQELRHRRIGPSRGGLVLIDGRSGSGKTQFAAQLHDLAPHAQVLHLDDLYPGWDGLQYGVDAAADFVRAWSEGQCPAYTPTHWPGTAQRERVQLDPGSSLIVEGVGARRCLPSATHGFMPLAIYLDVPTEIRRDRAMSRDGATYEPHWDQWASQEEALLASLPITRDDPDLIIVSEE